MRQGSFYKAAGGRWGFRVRIFVTICCRFEGETCGLSVAQGGLSGL